jgi:hypothetical protein
MKLEQIKAAQSTVEKITRLEYDIKQLQKIKELLINPDKNNPHYPGFVFQQGHFGNSQTYLDFNLSVSDIEIVISLKRLEVVNLTTLLESL